MVSFQSTAFKKCNRFCLTLSQIIEMRRLFLSCFLPSFATFGNTERVCYAQKITKMAYRSFCRLLQLQIATIKRKKVEWCAIKMHSNFVQYITKVQTKKNLVHPVLKRVCTEPTKKKEVLQCLALARRKKLQIFKFVTLMEKDGPFC